MFEFLISIIPYITPVFVVSTMLNIGLTQKLSELLKYRTSIPFVQASARTIAIYRPSKKNGASENYRKPRNNWSGRRDLNSRPLAPQANALPDCATSRKDEIKD